MAKRTNKKSSSKKTTKKATTRKGVKKTTARKTKAKGGATTKKTTKATESTTQKMKPVTSAFIADEAKKARKVKDAATVLKGSQAETALKVLASASEPMSHSDVVAACARRRVEVKWPVGLLRNLEQRGLVQKFKGGNKRVAFVLTGRGKTTVAAF